MNSNSLHFIFYPLFMIICTMAYGQEDKSEVYISRYEGISSNTSIHNIFIDNEGLIWLAASKGVFLLDPGKNTADLKLNMPNVMDVTKDYKGNYWAAAENKLYNINGGDPVVLPNDGKITDLDVHKTLIYIASDKGLFTYTPNTGRLIQYTERNSKLNSSVINFVHADQHDIVWIGTDNGYVRIEGDKWEDEDKDYQMLVTTENTEGQWIISEDDMFLINEFNRLYPVGIDEYLYQGKINAFTLDSKGRIYIASDILVRYDPYEERIENYAEDAGLISKKCLSIATDRNDNIWIGTENAGLFQLLFSDIARDKLTATCILDESLSCFGKSDAKISVIVNGGNAPYRYQWNKSDLRINKLMNLSAGKYTVTVTDDLGRESVNSITIADPEPLKIYSLDIKQKSGNGKDDGRISVSADGGTPPYQYTWSNGEKNGTISNLTSGNYEVIVSDANGCTVITSAEIEKEKLLPDLTLDKLSVGTTLRLEQLFFDADSTVLREENFPILDEIYTFLRANPNVIIEIGGHTNTIPPHEYCDRLSTERAKNVAFYLYNKGITERRIAYKGYGKRNPLTDDKSRVGRQRNQRVELKILSI